MNDTESNREKPYFGLLGLDKLPAAAKALNFVVTLIIGSQLAFASWIGSLDREPIYRLSPFAWPLVFLFAWPLCGVALWLRLTGLSWFWSLLAAGMIIVLYYLELAVLYVLVPS